MHLTLNWFGISWTIKHNEKHIICVLNNILCTYIMHYVLYRIVYHYYGYFDIHQTFHTFFLVNSVHHPGI